MARTLAIGDIHGCLTALDALLAKIQPAADDSLVPLGDYVDRGPDSRGVIERLIELEGACRLTPLLGNHDEMLLAIHAGAEEFTRDWLAFGGDATLASYGVAAATEIPQSHIDFLHRCRLYHETERHFFAHANYYEDLPLDWQPRDVLLWEPLRRRQPGPHRSGKTAIVGHTSQKSGEVLDLGYLVCIDTWCYGEGWLTALDIDSGQIWQANKLGHLRKPG